MTILKWARRKLRKFLGESASEKPKLDFQLDCMIRNRGKTETARFVIRGSAGLRLIGERIGEPGTRLIDSGEALDGNQFWALWRHFNPDRRIEWEDGTPATP